MNLLDQLVEARILAAQARGELSHLPGEGAPLRLDDDLLVPVEVRAVARVLRNAGYVPPELLLLKDADHITTLAACSECSEDRRKALRRLEVLLQKLETAGFAVTSRAVMARYHQRLLDRLTG